MSALFQPILISEEVSIAREREKLLNEDWSYASFMTWTIRKLKGFAVSEIDYLAKQVVNLKSHEDRFDLLVRIRDAINAANTKLHQALKSAGKGSKEDQNRITYLREHVAVLRVLEQKCQAFDIIAHAESEKRRDEHTRNEEERMRKLAQEERDKADRQSNTSPPEHTEPPKPPSKDGIVINHNS
jgi:hypothetical protein